MSYLGPTLRRRRLSPKPWQRAGLALVIAVAINALLLKEVRLDWALGAGHAPKAVALAPLSAQQWAANKNVLANPPGLVPAIPQQPVVPPAPKNTVTPPGQVVDVSPSKDNTAPQDSRFVSDRNNTVEKETRSKFAKAGYANTLPTPSEPKKPETQSRGGGNAGEDGTATSTKAQSAAKPGFDLQFPDQRASERLALKFDPFGQMRARDEQTRMRGNRDRVAMQQGKEAEDKGESRAGKRGPRDIANLMPTAATFDRIAGGPAPDRLDGVEVGEGTYLNTREWKYATYFNRIKQAVAQNWDPNSALATRDPNGTMYAYKDRITVVQVTLDDSGALKDVQVEKASGADFLDATALEAFRRASPFVNPPKGLADQRGEIHFAFGFYLEVGNAGMRIFRMQRPQ